MVRDGRREEGGRANWEGGEGGRGSRMGEEEEPGGCLADHFEN